LRKIGFKIFISFLCMAAITIGLLWLIQAVFLKDSYLDQRVEGIETALKSVPDETDIDYAALEAEQNINILSVDASGNVIYLSEGLPMRGQLTRMIPSLISQSANGQVLDLQMESQNTRYAMIGEKLSDDLYVFALFSMVDVNEASRLLLQQLWIVTAVLTVVSVVLALILSRMFSKPIIRVTQSARRMAEGKLDVALPVRSKDEIGQLTQALNELSAELRKTESLRRELIANVSHELRSPLSVIQGYAETVRDVTWPNEEKRTAQLTIVSDEAARLSRIVTDILDYSRMQSGVDLIQVETFSLRPVLEDRRSSFEVAAAGKDIRLELHGDESMVRFDKNKLLQVLNNLLSNATNHAPEHSVITIRAENLKSRTRISITNTGTPIPASELDRIWERYHQVPQMQGTAISGTGLGLSIVKSILDLHAVPFGVSSDETETVFWFETVPMEDRRIYTNLFQAEERV
jgi:signal transduction histidine kinase